MMKRAYRQGVSLSEYALVLGLVGVTAIPVLQTLGNTISFQIDAASNPGRLNTMMGLDPAGNPIAPAVSVNSPALVTQGTGSGVPTPNPVQAPSVAPVTPTPADLSNTVQAVLNPSTNQIEFRMFDGQGAGTNATSVEGTKLLAMQMEEILENYTLPDGSKLDDSDEVRSLLKTLIKGGFDLADSEESVIGETWSLSGLLDTSMAKSEFADGVFDSLGMMPLPTVEENFANNYVSYAGKYEALIAEAEKYGPKYDGLIEQVAPLAWLTQSIAAENFLQDIMADNGGTFTASEREVLSSQQKVCPPLELNSNTYDAYVIGVPAGDTSWVSVDISPTVTRQAAEKMGLGSTGTSQQNGNPANQNMFSLF